MPNVRRLEDRILRLCAKAIAAEPTELDPIFSELKSALKEHTQKIRAMVAASVILPQAQTPAERRKTDTPVIPNVDDLDEVRS
jgi:hypothetical protein